MSLKKKNYLNMIYFLNSAGKEILPTTVYRRYLNFGFKKKDGDVFAFKTWDISTM